MNKKLDPSDPLMRGLDNISGLMRKKYPPPCHALVPIPRLSLRLEWDGTQLWIDQHARLPAQKHLWVSTVAAIVDALPQLLDLLDHQQSVAGMAADRESTIKSLDRLQARLTGDRLVQEERTRGAEVC